MTGSGDLMRVLGHDARVAALGAATLFSAVLLPATAAEAATPTCFGKVATHVMQPGEGTYVLHAGKVEVVVGSSGPDSIINGDSNATDVGDYLCGGGGNDYISAGAGPDHISGGDGDDSLRGWRGADVIQGDAGNDTISEGSQSDQDNAKDIVHGGSGNDSIAVGWGKDQAYGDGGSDRLYDTECDGPTVLNGGAGNDYFESYRASYEGSACSTMGAVGDKITGGGGTDTATVDGLDTLVTVEKVTRV